MNLCARLTGEIPLAILEEITFPVTSDRCSGRKSMQEKLYARNQLHYVVFHCSYKNK